MDVVRDGTEGMLKYIFHNAMIYYDATAMLFGENRN